MKIVSSLVVLASGTAAFVVPGPSGRVATLRRSESSEEVPEPVPVRTAPKMSQSLPWMECPPALDGTLAGDVGFDPVGFAKTKDDLLKFREAEVKHGRLAMLAAAGWPLSELLDKQIADILGLPAVVDTTNRAPSLLNGGLGKISPLYWVAVLVAASAIDIYGITRMRSNAPGYIPGDFGFDPLGLYPKTEEGKARMELAEIKHGRLSMIAITAFAVQEFVYKSGVVDKTSLFFRPIGSVMSEYANSGYIVPGQ